MEKGLTEGHRNTHSRMLRGLPGCKAGDFLEAFILASFYPGEPTAPSAVGDGLGLEHRWSRRKRMGSGGGRGGLGIHSCFWLPDRTRRRSVLLSYLSWQGWGAPEEGN